MFIYWCISKINHSYGLHCPSNLRACCNISARAVYTQPFLHHRTIQDLWNYSVVVAGAERAKKPGSNVPIWCDKGSWSKCTYGTSSWNRVSSQPSLFSDVNLLVMMYDSESLTNETIPCRMSEATAALPCLRLPSFEACLNRWNLFAADQDGRDWAGIAEVRAAVGKVLLPRPAGWPQSGRTHRLPTANTRGHGE